jgi:protein-S-isoprenylcysteine O-methyltransferase Ste14
MRVAYFVWLMGSTALVLPFLDLLWRTTRTSWVERAFTARVVLFLLELGAIATWALLRGDWTILPQPDPLLAGAGSLLALTGGLLSAWARVTLGRLFSPHLGVQREHQLIESGPYAIVRHPMYLGIIDFIFGSALVWNDAGLLALAAAFTVFFTVQLRFEEEIFARHFGEAYARYRRRTPALLPRLRPVRRRP